VNIFKNHIH